MTFSARLNRDTLRQPLSTIESRGTIVLPNLLAPFVLQLESWILHLVSARCYDRRVFKKATIHQVVFVKQTLTHKGTQPKNFQPRPGHA